MLTERDYCDAIVARAKARGLGMQELRVAAELRPEVCSDLYARRRMPCVSARRRIALVVGTTPEDLLVLPEDTP